MAFPPRNGSHVPKVRCTTCGQDVEMILMAEHICSQAPPAPSIPVHPMGLPSPALSNSSLPPSDASHLQPRRPTLPKLDSQFNRPFAGQMTPASSDQGSVGSPASTTSGRRSPWRAPKRAPVAIPKGPPSPELSNLDCAFPPFPTSGNKSSSSKDDKKKRNDSRNGQHKTGTPPDSRRSSKQFGSSTSRGRSASTASSRKRSKSNAADVRPSTAAGDRKISNSLFPGARSGTPDDPPPLPSISPGPFDRPHPLTRSETTPVLPSDHANDTTASLPPLHKHPSADAAFANQPPQPPILPEPVGASTGTEPFPNREPSYRAKRPPPIVSNIPLAQDGQPIVTKSRSPTVPPHSANSLGRSLTKLFGRRRSQSNATRREIVRAALSDESEAILPTPPLSDSTFDSPRQTPAPPVAAPLFTPTTLSEPANEPPQGRTSPLLPAMHTEPAEPPRIMMQPAVTPSNAADMQFNFGLDVPRHTSPEPIDPASLKPTEPAPSASIAQRPTEMDLRRASMDSASSYESEDFSERTASSRSSPPPNDELTRKIAESLTPEVEKQTVIEMPPPLRTRDLEVVIDSPTDPCFVDGKLSPIPDDRPPAPSEASISAQLAMPPPPRPPPPPAVPVVQERKDSLPRTRPRKDSLASTSRPIGPNKGICRGCSKPIMPNQKSVSSADGRLTGRYHKECFVCWTCKTIFPTAEFYVIRDHPYCGYHYHKLENSLCASCGKGIEGQYMETANVAGKGREKHHAQCLKCTTCRVQLSHDYFELSGKVYCERDAFRIASFNRTHDRSPARPSPLVREYISSGSGTMKTGQNFPERRTTRLMATA